LSRYEVQAVGTRLFERVREEIMEGVGRRLPPEIMLSVSLQGGHTEFSLPGYDYQALGSGGMLKANLRFSDPPLETATEITPMVGVSANVSARFAFIVFDANRPALDPLLLRLDELHPTVTAVAETKVDAWVENALAQAIKDLNRGLSQNQGLR
jgi:hypothetical protein